MPVPNEPKAMIDRLVDLEVEEHGGVIRSLTRLITVIGLGEEDTDYRILTRSLAAAGVPEVPSTLEGDEYGMLTLVDRKVRLTEREDFGACDVTLHYRHLLDGDNQELVPALGGALTPETGNVIYGKTRCSVQQTETNFFWDYSKAKLNGSPVKTQIVVAHTYPDGKTASGDGIFYPADPNFAGQTFFQGGAITIPVPQLNYQTGGYIDTFDPDSVANQMIATVNKNLWRGQPPRTWLCMEVSWEIYTPGRYRFGFEFQNNPDTWDPYAVFIDERSRRPPPGLWDHDRSIPAADGVGPPFNVPAGWKQIPYLYGVDYDLLLNAFFEGNQILTGQGQIIFV